MHVKKQIIFILCTFGSLLSAIKCAEINFDTNNNQNNLNDYWQRINAFANENQEQIIQTNDTLFKERNVNNNHNEGEANEYVSSTDDEEVAEEAVKNQVAERDPIHNPNLWKKALIEQQTTLLTKKQAYAIGGGLAIAGIGVAIAGLSYALSSPKTIVIHKSPSLLSILTLGFL